MKTLRALLAALFACFIGLHPALAQVVPIAVSQSAGVGASGAVGAVDLRSGPSAVSLPSLTLSASLPSLTLGASLSLQAVLPDGKNLRPSLSNLAATPALAPAAAIRPRSPARLLSAAQVPAKSPRAFLETRVEPVAAAVEKAGEGLGDSGDSGDRAIAQRQFSALLGEKVAVESPSGVDAGRSGGGIRTAADRPTGQKLAFMGVGARDVYNPTAPFMAKFRGRQIEILAARVEPRLSEASEAMFFERAGSGWRPLAGAPVLKLQDPFVSRVGSELVVGGVETFPEEGGGLGYRTVFYRGKDLAGLKPFAHGPDGMKDIRLIALPKGEILVLTRPQGQVGGAGKIAVTMIENLGSLGPDAINRAEVIEDLFTPDEWGGANELHLLKNGLVGVLGHVAHFDGEGNRHYFPMAFAFDPKTGRRWPMKILVKRSQLPSGVSKRPDLEDVLFSGGLIRGGDKTAELYVGAGDAEVYRVSIPDPFTEFENLSR